MLAPLRAQGQGPRPRYTPTQPQVTFQGSSDLSRKVGKTQTKGLAANPGRQCQRPADLIPSTDQGTERASRSRGRRRQPAVPCDTRVPSVPRIVLIVLNNRWRCSPTRPQSTLGDQDGEGISPFHRCEMPRRRAAGTRAWGSRAGAQGSREVGPAAWTPSCSVPSRWLQEENILGEPAGSSLLGLQRGGAESSDDKVSPRRPPHLLVPLPSPSLTPCSCTRCEENYMFPET